MNICMKEFGSEKIIFGSENIIFDLEKFGSEKNTFPIQCRHIEHMHEGIYNFCLHRFY